MFRYDMHVHTNVGSKCGVSTPEEQVAAYAAAGYSGFVLTDHFIHGNTAIDRSLPWAEKIARYYAAVLRAREAAKKYEDFTVFFGLEHAFAGGREILLHGVTPELLLAHPEFEKMPIEPFCNTLRALGCLLVTAHPFRVRPYNDDSVPPDPDFVDGVEVYNAHNGNDGENAQALVYARRKNFLPFSGGDVHDCTDPLIGDAGIATTHPLRSAEDLLQTLRRRDYALIVHGRITPPDALAFQTETAGEA